MRRPVREYMLVELSVMVDSPALLRSGTIEQTVLISRPPPLAHETSAAQEYALPSFPGCVRSSYWLPVHRPGLSRYAAARRYFGLIVLRWSSADARSATRVTEG